MEKTISSKLLHEGRNFSFKTDIVSLENGRETVRDVVEHPGAVAIVPVDGEDIVLVRQYRYAAAKELLEIPAGTLEPGEDPFACAVRELREETGYAASSWTQLLSCFMAPGYSSEVIYFYVAEGLTEVGSSPEEDEVIRVERFGFNEVIEMIESNRIEDSKTITGVLSYLTRSSP
ncbi:NUDIX hydrolase [Candidatus Bathyarchaeota archaeon]|nr:NUDIX hydrolase [Candidatus Bathyarchaeota archaeon]